MNGLDERGLYDIYSVWHLPFWQTGWFFWGIVSVIVVSLTGAMYFLYRWYRNKNIKPITPWEKALQTIADLQKSSYETKEKGKQCYFILTGALKNYFESRYQFPISTKTDEEVSRYLEEQLIDNTMKKELQSILQGCLLTKFANEQAMEEQIKKHLDQATSIVRSTIPQKQS